MNNFDINQLMGMISKMDKKDIERGMKKFSSMLSEKDKENIMKQFGGMNNNTNNYDQGNGQNSYSQGSGNQGIGVQENKNLNNYGKGNFNGERR